MFSTVYIIGVVISWILFKIIRSMDDDRSWTGIYISLIFSALSWIGVLGALLAMLVLKEDFKGTKPPPWL